MHAQAGDSWSTIGKIAVVLFVAPMVVGLISSIPFAIWAARKAKAGSEDQARRNAEILDEAIARAGKKLSTAGRIWMN